MSPYETRKLLEEYMPAAAHDYAVCGVQAVRDVVRELIKPTRLAIEALRVDQHKGHTIKVSLTYYDMDSMDRSRAHLCTFEVRNPCIAFGSWERALRFIKSRQGSSPPHLGGMEHNATEEVTRAVTEMIQRATGYTVTLGDLWVRICDGTEVALVDDPSGGQRAVKHKSGDLCFGYLTRAGEIVMKKYQSLSKEQAATVELATLLKSVARFTPLAMPVNVPDSNMTMPAEPYPLTPEFMAALDKFMPNIAKVLRENSITEALLTVSPRRCMLTFPSLPLSALTPPVRCEFDRAVGHDYPVKVLDLHPDELINKVTPQHAKLPAEFTVGTDVFVDPVHLGRIAQMDLGTRRRLRARITRREAFQMTLTLETGQEVPVDVDELRIGLLPIWVEEPFDVSAIPAALKAAESAMMIKEPESQAAISIPFQELPESLIIGLPDVVIGDKAEMLAVIQKVSDEKRYNGMRACTIGVLYLHRVHGPEGPRGPGGVPRMTALELWNSSPSGELWYALEISMQGEEWIKKADTILSQQEIDFVMAAFLSHQPIDDKKPQDELPVADVTVDVPDATKEEVLRHGWNDQQIRG